MLSNRTKGRPSDYDEGFVRDISEQVLIAFYNERQETLKTQIIRDPDYVSKLRNRAGSLDSIVRAWLQALDYVPRNHPTFHQEVTFRQWCLRLEPPMTPHVLAKLPLHEQGLRAAMIGHFTDEYWRINCKRWIDAVTRVRQDKYLKLNVPQISYGTDDEEEYL